jgi:hypothetical protein
MSKDDAKTEEAAISNTGKDIKKEWTNMVIPLFYQF